MARRKNLVGIAAGILGSFLSRNNDVEGYWGLGVLRLQAEGQGLSKVTIDLLGDDTQSLDASIVIRRHYGRLLESLLKKMSMDRRWVKRAEVAVEFGTSGCLLQSPVVTWGDPLICKVSITDDRGRVHQVSGTARCASHDPRREQRRAGY